MAAPTKPKMQVLETFYSVSAAAVRLGLREPDDPSKKGEKWLRDGVNLQGFSHFRMAGQLLFSDSDLAAIAETHRNKADRRGRVARQRRPRRTASASAAA